MAPVVKLLNCCRDIEAKVCLTGQHREMLGQVMEIFDLKADFDLKVMAPDQTLTHVTSKVLSGMENIFNQWRPDCVLVQGDTTTTFTAALAAFYFQIDLAHIEAGLRTHHRYSPFPEEMNRCLTSQLATLHFAPTKQSRLNLLREDFNDNCIFMTGNTGVDALFEATQYIDNVPELMEKLQNQFQFINPNKRMILVTGHRRENFGEGFQSICQAIRELAQREDIYIVYPVHLNPKILKPANEILSGLSNVHLISPLDYLSFLHLMRNCYLILTDSGGIQEEAPSLGKPVLVMRDSTERPEGLEAGTVLLVGSRQETIVENVHRLLDDPAFYQTMSQAHNPYGDGKAGERIVDVLKERYLKQ